MGDMTPRYYKKSVGAYFIVCILMISSTLIMANSDQFLGNDLNTGDNLQDRDEIKNFKTSNDVSTSSRGYLSENRAVDLNNWTSLHGDNLNHGYSTATVPKIDYTLWTRKFKNDDNTDTMVYSSPAVLGNQIFIGAGNMRFYSLDKYTGAINWEVSTDDMPGSLSGGAIDSSPLVANDRVYFGCDDFYFYCFDATPDDDSDGTIEASEDEGVIDATDAEYDLIWYFKTNGSIKSSPKLSGNTVIIGCYDNPTSIPASLYALNANSGDLIWNYTPPLLTKFHSTPAIENDIVYVGLETEDGAGYPTVYAFDLQGFSDGNDGWDGESKTGTKNADIIWNITTPGSVDSSIVIAGNRILFGTLDQDGTVFALNKNNGIELWNATTGDQVYSAPAVDIDNNALYIGSDNGKLFAFNLSNGDEFWSYSVGAGIKSTPVVANNKVLFGSNDGYFYAIKSTTLAIQPSQRFIWKKWTDGSVQTSAAPVEGILFVSSESGVIYCFTNPDLAVRQGSLRVSEETIYEGETVQITAKVYNNGSMKLTAKANFYLHLKVLGKNRARAIEQNLIKSFDIYLDIDQEIPLEAETTIAKRDWSIIEESFLLIKIENVSFPEKAPFEKNNLDIEGVTILEPYVGGWMSYQRDNRNSGFGDFGARTNKTIWQYDSTLGASTGMLRSSPLFAKGRVFIGSTNGNLYSIVDSNGKKDWDFSTGSSITGSPALLMSETGEIEYEKIFFGSEDGKVYALETNRGQLNWSYDTNGDTIRGSPLITNGVVYIGTMSGNLLALDEDGFFDGDQGFDDTDETITKGDLLWNLTLPSAIRSTPALAGDFIIIVASSGSNHQIYALDMNSGAINWSYKFSSQINGAPLVDSKNGRIYIGCTDNMMYALDINGLWNGNQGWTGESSSTTNNADVLWNFNAQASIHTTGAIDTNNNHLIFGTSGGKVYALNAKTGNMHWSYLVGGVIFAPPTIANGYVYVASDNGYVYCLNESKKNLTSTETTQIWKFNTSSSLRAPVIAINNAIYFGTDDGILYKLGAPNDPPVAILSEPMLNQTFFTDEDIILNGSGSYDPEGDTNLKYIWTYTKIYESGAPVELYQGPRAIFNTTLPPGNYTIHLEVRDGLGTPSIINSTNIFVYKPVIGFFENKTIPTKCWIYYDGIGGIDLQSAIDPGAGTPTSPSGKSVGGTNKFVFQYYFSFKPNYKVGWYNISVEYSATDIGELADGYNFSRVRMFNRAGTTWVKCTDTGNYEDTENNMNIVWANLSGDLIKPNEFDLYAAGTFDNFPPIIEVQNVTPVSGNKDDTFMFEVKFTDKDNDLPSPTKGGYVKILINDKQYLMEEVVKNYNDTSKGKYYTFSIDGSDLDPDNNVFQILAHDGTYLVKSDYLAGPDVDFGEPPVAEAGDDLQVKVNEVFALDGSLSSDPDGKINKYYWDTDDDDDFFDSDGSMEGVTTTWRFEEEGQFTITLKVVDNENNTDTDTIIVTVTKEIKDDGDDTDQNTMLLYAGVAGLLILIILIIILLMVRRKVKTERDRKAFMIEEEEEEFEEEEEEEELEEEEEEELEEEDEEEEFEDEDEEELEEELDEEEEELEDEELEEELEKELEEEELEVEELEVEELEEEEAPEKLEEISEEEIEPEEEPVEIEEEPPEPEPPKKKVKKPVGAGKKLKLKDKPKGKSVKRPKGLKKVKKHKVK